MFNFNAYSRYYDLLYQDKDYKSETNYVLNTLQKYAGKKVKNILELGCGSGSHAKYFSELGCNTTGIERSESMVQLAMQKKIKKFKPVLGDITNFSIKKKFDAAISLFHVISYVTDNASLIRCFHATAAHLKRDGLFLFDIWYTPAVLHLKPETRIKRMEDERIAVTRIAEATINDNSDIVDVAYEIIIQNKTNGKSETVFEKHPMRHFSLPELKMLAYFTGFKFLYAEEFLTKRQPANDTWGTCVVLQKI